jgi:hypothetical protein
MALNQVLHKKLPGKIWHKSWESGESKSGTKANEGTSRIVPDLQLMNIFLTDHSGNYSSISLRRGYILILLGILTAYISTEYTLSLFSSTSSGECRQAATNHYSE